MCRRFPPPDCCFAPWSGRGAVCRRAGRNRLVNRTCHLVGIGVVLPARPELSFRVPTECYLLEPVGSRLRVFEAVAAVSVAAMRWHARFAQRCLIRAGFGLGHNHGRAASATYDDVLHDYLCSPCCRLGSAYPARDQGKADALRKGRDGDGYQVTQRISK
jgi:hypothetical protein